VTETIPAPEGYRIELYGTPGGPGPDDLLALFEREPGILAPEVASRRIHEALLVAIGPGDEFAGVMTAHIERSRQLHLSFWHLAAFVDRPHRKSYVGAVMALRAREHLRELYESGQDRRAAGLMMEFHHHGLRTHFDMADRLGFAFIGQTRGGHNRWVGYFPGVLAPEPPGAAEEPEPALPAPEAAPPPPTAEGPVFVIAAPGSGGAALRDALSGAPELVVVDEPSLELGDDGRLEAADAVDEVADAVRAGLSGAAGDRRPLVHGVHDTLRVPFLHAVFPDATFVFLHREPDQAVPAAVAGWESGEHVSAPDLRGWDGPPWSFALTPGWRSLRDAPLAEVAAAQWEAATRTAVADLQRLPPERWSVVDHAALRADPGAELARIATFAGATLDAVPELPEEGPAAAEVDLGAVLRRTDDTAAVARTLFASGDQPEPAPPAGPGGVQSATTESFTDVLAQIHASVLVSAPEAGAVVTLRRAGGSLNTHLAPLPGPSGVAARAGRLAIGTPTGVAGHRDVPMARNRLGGNIRRDSCFVPSDFQVTGDVGVSELAYAGDELWLVATRFSCLATLDGRHSFVPRWQPPFVTELAAEDRCHLNGVCVVQDEVRYVTALGATDRPGGWRDGVDSGGVVVDVRDGRTVASGLAVPFSPRWHGNRLWVLLARQGALATVDPGTGAIETVARVPGFARGLAFHDRLAFVGVSALRGAPAGERRTGVWAIDLTTGATVAFLEFSGGIDQIADVQLLPATAFPEIVAADSDAARNAFLLP